METGLQRSDSISRQVSTHAVMAAILHHGPISRADISRETGLSKQTASEIVRMLESEGWIEEVGYTRGKVGRTAVLYQIVPESAYIIGIDLGGTKIAAAVADMTCSLVTEMTQPTHKDGGQHVVDQIVGMCRQLAEKAGIAWGKIRLGVVGMPGVINPRTGFVDFAPNIPGFDTLSVKDALSEGLGLDVVIENDVNLAVIGERWQGAGQGINNLAFIALGTGIGQGLIIDGTVVRGARGGAGEIGYLPMGINPFSDEARTTGAFESAVGSHAMLRSYKEKQGRGNTVRELFEMAERGEAAALEVLNETAQLMALGVAATVALFDPEKIIFGGSIGMREELIDRIRSVLPQCMRYPVPIEVSALGNRAPIMGALAIGLNKLHSMMYGTQLPYAEVTLPLPEEIQVSEVAT
jgi:predicted NBD/HSP70 family sugar kinase/predicted transcriptional regulator